MRMDRYENMENDGENKQTRTNKNQELYTDLYLNNVYVDINSLKDVVQGYDEKVHDEYKISSQNKNVSYNYEDKNYDIKSLIEEAISNSKDDKLKRNLDIIEINNQEIDSLIESINENQNNGHESVKENENLLSDLLPSDDNTKVIPALEEPILDTKLIDKKFLENNDEEGNQELIDTSMKELQSDTSFVEEKKSRLKIILPIVLILIIVFVIVFILIKKMI